MAREKELRRSLAVFPIGTVMKLTDLTARQIRYYEDQGLIQPERTAGNRRMYSLNDMDRLLEIKDFWMMVTILQRLNMSTKSVKFVPNKTSGFNRCGRSTYLA